DALMLDLEAALPPGSDRLLIEAQSGTTLGETPFAATLTLTLPRTDSQRRMQVGEARSPSEVLLRTMRVTPLPSPHEPQPTQARPGLHAGAPGRVAIVAPSALVSGLIGALTWWQITAHRAPSHPLSLAADPVRSPDTVPRRAAAPVPSSPAPAVPTAAPAQAGAIAAAPHPSAPASAPAGPSAAAPASHPSAVAPASHPSAAAPAGRAIATVQSEHLA